MKKTRPEEKISVRKRQYPVPETVLRQLTFVIDVIDVMNIDDGDERLDLKRSSEIGLAYANNIPP